MRCKANYFTLRDTSLSWVHRPFHQGMIKFCWAVVPVAGGAPLVRGRSTARDIEDGVAALARCDAGAAVSKVAASWDVCEEPVHAELLCSPCACALCLVLDESLTCRGAFPCPQPAPTCKPRCADVLHAL